MKDIRTKFPALSRQVYGKDLIYLDNAATSQKPLSVIDFQERFLRESNANIHRAVHKLSGESTDMYEAGRDAVRDFIGAEHREEVIFTSGTTASMNLLADCFSRKFLKEGDKVLVSMAEHHSNIVPWQMACEKRGAILDVVDVDDRGCLSVENLEAHLDERVKIVSIAHVSNILGVVNPIAEIADIVHSHSIPLAVDGAQGIVHTKVDVKELGCDFYAFSGHKIYAPTGIGILYGKKKYLEEMPPYMGGGDMIESVSFEKTTYAPIPLKYEAGTQNFVAAACLKPALEFAEEVANDSSFRKEEREIVNYMMEELKSVEGLRVYGDPEDLNGKVPLFSMAVDGVYATDLAMILDKSGIAVRSGHMCAEPLLTRFGQTSILRASFAANNTLEEGRIFVEALRKAIKMLK